MHALIVALMALAPSLLRLVQTAPALAQEAAAQTRQPIPVDVVVEAPGDTFRLAGDSWLQARVTSEPGGTRVDGVLDWHGVVLTGLASGSTYHATNNLNFSYRTRELPPFAFDLATGLLEREGIFYFFEHSDEDHGLTLPNQPQLLVAFTIRAQVDLPGVIRASYGDVRIRCDRCRP